jgi:hypothetical protein
MIPDGRVEGPPGAVFRVGLHQLGLVTVSNRRHSSAVNIGLPLVRVL